MTLKLLQFLHLHSFYRSKIINKRFLYQTQNVRLKLTSKSYTKGKTTKLPDYSDEDKVKILNTINESENELNKYNISQNRIKKIELWKSKNGSFQTIEQILEIDNFNVKSFDKFCKNVLNNNDNSKTIEEQNQINKKIKNVKNIKRFNNLCTPLITDNIRFTYKECLSLHIMPSNITWTKFFINYEKNFIEIIDWDNLNLIDNKKLHINDLIIKCLEYDLKIPLADCYVIENPQIIQSNQLSGNTEQIRTNVQKSQLIALLSYMLTKRNLSMISDENKENVINYVLENPSVFYLKRFIASRLFNTFIGNEIVSSEQAVLNLMRTHYNIEDIINDKEESSNVEEDNQIKLNNVIFPMELRKMYDTSEGYKKEFLGQSLLIGLAFIRLCLLKCPKSLKMIGINV